MTSLRRFRGFTLIEVMVALLILSVMAGMAWKGLDGIVRAREISDQSVRRTLRLQAVMTQWQADLNAVVDTQMIDPLRFDGAAMRLTRQTPGGMQVVVWALRSGRWVRWAGPPVTTVGQLQEQWTNSLQFQGWEPGSLAALKGIEQWQVYFFYRGGGGWANAQSSAGASTNPLVSALGGGRPPMPTGVRSVLTLGPDSGYEGRVDRSVLLGGS